MAIQLNNERMWQLLLCFVIVGQVEWEQEAVQDNVQLMVIYF